MAVKIALIGNPNCGKTTLFNRLTGAKQKVGNWSGVTVDKKEGRYRKNRKITVVDLPGIYSLYPYSDDERAVTDFLVNTPPDIIINVIDATRIERGLNLTVELSKLNIPVIIALNMWDEAVKRKMNINTDVIEGLFETKVFKISAAKGNNVKELMTFAENYKSRPVLNGFLSKNTDLDKQYAYFDKLFFNERKSANENGKKLADKIDGIFLHKIFGLPIFFLIITAVYYLTVKIGGKSGETINDFFCGLSEKVLTFSKGLNIPLWTADLIGNGIIKGVGAVASFLPQILVLFFILSLLEESGYMARGAFITDRVLKRFGLNGKSVIPMTVACGCNASGINACKTIEKKCEKRATVFACGTMPCGAKTAVFSFLAQKLFNGNPFIAASTYFVSVLFSAVIGTIFGKASEDKNDIFILEIPDLKMPSVKNVYFALHEKTKDFLFKTGTVIFSVSVVLWALIHIGAKGYVNTVEESFIYSLATKTAIIFKPLGFDNWQAQIAFISSLFAKEAVIEIFGMTTENLAGIFESGFSAYAFMLLILLSPPCVSAIFSAKNVLKEGKTLVLIILTEFACGYFSALFVNTAGLLYFAVGKLIFTVILGIILSIVLAALIIIALKKAKIKPKGNYE